MKKKSARKNSMLIILFLFVAVIFFSINIINRNSKASVSTETVMTGIAEDKVSANGYIIRNEFVVNAPDTGVITFRFDEGKRVARGSQIAAIYTGDVSDSVKNELSSLHDRINELEGSSAEKKLLAGDSVVGTAQVVNDVDAISKAVYKRDVSDIPQYKDDITRLIRNVDGGSSALTTLEQMQTRKNELESQISGNVTSVYAPVSGVLCSTLDGCEDYFNIEKINDITPKYLKDFSKQNSDASDKETIKDTPCLKLINNYEWYFAANVDEKWLSDIKVGAEISLRFPNISDEKLDGIVYGISEPDGKVATIIIQSDNTFSGMYTQRELKAEIIRKTYRGFKVSKEAIHVTKDGEYFVYINSEGIVKRREIEILYSDSYYAIVAENNKKSDYLLLYDEVIVSGNNIKEGASI